MAIVVDKKAWIKPTHWHYSHVIGDSVNIICTYSPWHTIPSSWGSMSVRCFVHASFLPSDAYDSSSAWFIHNKALPEGVVSYNVHICDGTSVPHPPPPPHPPRHWEYNDWPPPIHFVRTPVFTNASYLPTEREASPHPFSRWTRPPGANNAKLKADAP